MPETGREQPHDVPARFLPYESRALTYRSDARKLARTIVVTTVVCGGLAVLSFLVGERRIVEWAGSAAGDEPTARDVATFVLRAPRFLMYAVIALLFAIGLDRKQRFWVHVALIVLALELIFAGALVRILKIVIGRPRPTAGVQEFRPFLLTANLYHSFPSGDAAVVATSISFFVYFARRSSVRILCLVVLAMVVFERLMNAHHFPIDALAGAYLGFVTSFIAWHWFVVGFPLKKLRVWFGQDRPEAGSATAPAAGTEGAQR
jgi:membrane-associated phospholipid phosphatase